MIKTLVLAAAAFAAVPALAQETTVSMKVAYGDLDLGSAAGAATLNGRIKAAVRQVCGTGSSRSLAEFQSIHRCRVAARASALPQVNLALARAGVGSVVVAASR